MITLSDALTKHLADREHPSGAADTHAHASEAGACSRAIAYRLLQLPVTDPQPLTSLLALEIGTQLHKSLDAAFQHLYPEATIEASWEQGVLSGHADVFYTAEDGTKVVVEFKTANPFSWKYMQVPKREHYLQGQLNALGLKADAVRIIYLNISAKKGEDPIREWIVPFDAVAAVEEAGRQIRIQSAAIDTPSGIRGRVEREYEGHTLNPLDEQYPCSYCKWFRACISDGA
jgi:hypothetical protein